MGLMVDWRDLTDIERGALLTLRSPSATAARYLVDHGLAVRVRSVRGIRLRRTPAGEVLLSAGAALVDGAKGKEA